MENNVSVVQDGHCPRSSHSHALTINHDWPCTMVDVWRVFIPGAVLKWSIEKTQSAM